MGTSLTVLTKKRLVVERSLGMYTKQFHNKK